MNEFWIMFIMIFASWLSAESAKFILNIAQKRKLDIDVLFSYGGFPSAHSAFVSSLCCSIFLMQGFNVALLISLVIASIVVRDIVTLRDSIDKNSESIAKLSNNRIRIERIAHSIIDVSAGIVIGIIVPLIIYIAL